MSANTETTQKPLKINTLLKELETFIHTSHDKELLKKLEEGMSKLTPEIASRIHQLTQSAKTNETNISDDDSSFFEPNHEYSPQDNNDITFNNSLQNIASNQGSSISFFSQFTNSDYAAILLENLKKNIPNFGKKQRSKFFDLLNELKATESQIFKSIGVP